MIENKKQSRMTKQRKIILEELSNVTTHPTADEVYSMVRERLPNISLGTVYRNLELLAENNQILKLESAGSTRRFDANMMPHQHVRCVACGSVDDVFCYGFNANEILGNLPENVLDNGYTVLNVAIAYSGICPECKQNSKISLPEKNTIVYEKKLA